MDSLVDLATRPQWPLHKASELSRMVSAAFTIETIQGSILFAERTGCKVEHANEIMAIPRRLEAKGNHSLLLSTVVTVHHTWLSLCDAEVTFCQIRSTIREKWSVPSLRLASAHTHQAKSKVKKKTPNI
jgi:hypothetical protein